MDEYKKVVSSKLKFKGSVLPVKEKKSKKKSVKPSAKLEKLIVKPGEEKNYHPVEPVEDYRTEAEKRFDERLKQKEKDFIEKRSKMSYQEVVDVRYGIQDNKLTDHNDIPRIAAAGLG
ncbi:hypothetical protein JH06_3591 [Blastocystis sp. subtype 4]|uniref:hypothetical protein n=1 Tax=Blastocystis sp. subtype 4 TaxID=944170 RepID=UPI000711D23A|nr:hypothetical protein JH06_3591 [Blastocystis sp. subtype 4]KNB45554.1 hypothetical protein JH06_3591 [Blastocystis sp. subtype 4]|eukprot:XP_014529012.1 hypothetical protein JH06_3591 [Blastocystis sp. subtype 4]